MALMIVIVVVAGVVMIVMMIFRRLERGFGYGFRGGFDYFRGTQNCAFQFRFSGCSGSACAGFREGP
jgi:hypothetical protein